MPKGSPAKADPKKQEAFIEWYEEAQKNTSEEEPIIFGDGVHPTMATKISYGWIRKGKDKIISTSASRTRLNLMGSLDLETMSVTVTEHDTIDSAAMELHFQKLKERYPKAPKIHLILDRGPYNKSKETRQSAEKHGIIIHYLPPYSPNLNPIERLWKVMNEYVRNNRYFKTAKEFKTAILEFFNRTWDEISSNFIDRINDNFSVISASSD